MAKSKFCSQEHIDRSALLHTVEAAEYLGVSPAWLIRQRYLGTGPAYIRVGGSPRGAVRYQVADLDRWIAANRVSPTDGGANARHCD